MKKHKELCDKEELESCYVSAKTGDGLHTMFYHIAANVAGFRISKTELETEMRVMAANIIDHEQNDPTEKTFKQRLEEERKNRNDCVLL